MNPDTNLYPHTGFLPNATPIVKSTDDASACGVPVVNRDGSPIGISPSTTANTPAIETGVTALAANTARKGWMIQNLGTNPLFVLFGSGCTTTVFHMVLKAGGASNDGSGGSFSQMDGVVFNGEITIAGTSPSYVVTELT